MAGGKTGEQPSPLDPQMEDILASIRRILNEEAAEATAEDPFPLTQEMIVSGPDSRPPPQPAAPPPTEGEGLIAPAVAAAAAAALGNLPRNAAAPTGPALRPGGPSLEEIVREELRPLLKEWLDAHLPALVERVVRSEIERVVNRAAG
jgi:cell pole-organizing protein PopZ